MRIGILHVVLPTALTDFVNGLLGTKHAEHSEGIGMTVSARSAGRPPPETLRARRSPLAGGHCRAGCTRSAPGLPPFLAARSSTDIGAGRHNQDPGRTGQRRDAMARGTTLMVWTPPDGIDVPRWWC